MATGLLGKQRHSMCSKRPPSALKHAFVVTDQSRHTPRCAEIQPTSQQAAAATRSYRVLVLDTHTPPVACPRRGNRAMQIIGSTKQQW